MHFRKTAAGADQNVGRNAIPTTLIVGNNWECTFADEPLRTSIPVKGMHCSSCVSMIKKAVLRVAGVESVAVNLDSGLVVVEYDSSQSLSDVINAITRMGYKIIDADFLRGSEKQQTPLIH
jgi:copper chaperone CopZ